MIDDTPNKKKVVLMRVGIGFGVLAVVAMLAAVGWLIIRVTQDGAQQAAATTSSDTGSQKADANGLSLGDASSASGSGTNNDVALQGIGGGSTSSGQSSSGNTSSGSGQSSQPQSIPAPGAAPTSTDPKPVRSQTLPNGLKIDEYVYGTGDKATKAGDTVAVHYVGYLTNGTVFDTSLKGDKKPFVFKLGAGSVIPGWDIGLQDMHVNGVRRLTIPASLAYGAKGSPPSIPANATLIFDVQLVAMQ